MYVPVRVAIIKLEIAYICTVYHAYTKTTSNAKVVIIQTGDLFIYLFYFVTVTPPSVCHPNPCYNGGSCQETHSGYVCVCPENYGGPLCKGEAQSSYFTE